MFSFFFLLNIFTTESAPNRVVLHINRVSTITGACIP
nr:MAG TPA: hypothetical protein [Caudoviricetes sp.]